MKLIVALLVVLVIVAAQAQVEDITEVFGADSSNEESVVEDNEETSVEQSQPVATLDDPQTMGITDMTNCLQIYGRYCGPGYCDVWCPSSINCF
jgi:hypothetical protein